MEEIILTLVQQYGLIGVLFSTFLSYSILPLPSEAAIVLASQVINPFIVFLFALLGSTVGSVTNYIVGLYGIRWFFKKPNSKKEMRARKIFDKYGPISLVLFAWLPFIGDPLIILAGTLKMNFKSFLIYSTLGKIWYFILLIWFAYLIPFMF